ncbi:MAG: NAD(P)-binding protein, partial [Candidatus Hydrogenedentes bacterium]|nr:NAD(P)-binding protein [Candidatus Hydrogenedentota bacterium]
MSDSAVLVIGGGATGLQAAARLADTGAHVLLIDKMETVGGKMAALLSHDPALLHMNGGVAPPSLDSLRNDPRIEIMTLAELTEFSGKPGRFRATVEQKARFVTDACTQCNKCRQVCPVVLPNEHESGMTFRKAIYTPYRDAIPSAYVIDIDRCLNEPPNYLPCQRCVEVCEPNCIDFSMPDRESFTRKIDAVIVAVGFDLEGVPPIQGYDYGRHPDIVTGMELESLLSPVGPTGGFVERPFNGETPEKMLFILHDASLFAWACAAAQTRRLLEQDIADITVLHNT